MRLTRIALANCDKVSPTQKVMITQQLFSWVAFVLTQKQEMQLNTRPFVMQSTPGSRATQRVTYAKTVGFDKQYCAGIYLIIHTDSLSFNLNKYI